MRHGRGSEAGLHGATAYIISKYHNGVCLQRAYGFAAFAYSLGCASSAGASVHLYDGDLARGSTIRRVTRRIYCCDVIESWVEKPAFTASHGAITFG